MINPPTRHNLARTIVIVGVVLLAAITVGPHVLRHLRNANQLRSAFDPASGQLAPLPEPIVNLTASPQADGSLKLTWTGGAHCDGFLISKAWPLTGNDLPITDLPAGQFTYTMAPVAGEIWDYDIWVQGHSAQRGFGAPCRIRPPPAPESYQPGTIQPPAAR